jgi:hypothetical protein
MFSKADAEWLLAAVAVAKQLGDLALEMRYSAFELVDAISQRGDFAFNELLGAIANALIDLRRRLLQRLAGKPVIEHL